MKKSQIIFLAVGIVFIGLLYSLPRVVVENSPESVPMEEVGSAGIPGEAEETHEPVLSTTEREQVNSLKAELDNEDDREKFTILADSIGNMFLDAGKLDSAAYFYGLIADKVPEITYLEKAGNTYYEAYGFAMSEGKTAYFADKTREYLNQVLEKDPSRLDLRTKVAMTYVSSSNPMQGIIMLKEVLEEDPQNELALFNMGVLSMQSGQYKIAVERFEDLIANHPGNIEGQFYLGVSYFESKQNNKAKKQLQMVKEMTDDPQIIAGVDNYLDRL
ncbi:MAG: tetratricopeptide repeat protein [Anditalea sp.]